MSRFLSLIFCTVLLLSFLSCQSTRANELSTVSVSSSATVKVEADTASFSISAECVKETSEEARSESSYLIGTALDILVSEFKVEKKDLVTSHMVSTPYYEWENGKRILVGQMASQSVQITLSDLDNVGRIYDRLSLLDGLSISSISFSRKDTSAERREARVLAVRNARAKAEAYAEGLGLEISGVVAITDGSCVQYNGYRNDVTMEAAMPMMATAKGMDSSVYYVGDLSVSDSVTVVFSLK